MLAFTILMAIGLVIDLFVISLSARLSREDEENDRQQNVDRRNRHK